MNKVVADDSHSKRSNRSGGQEGVDSSDASPRPRFGTRGGRLAGYSRYVSFMKFLLPAIALGLVSLIFIWPQIQLDKRFSLSFSKIRSNEAEDPSMVNARFVGADKRFQPFSITADLAKNVLLGATVIELEMPKADIAISNDTWLVLTANTGFYDQKKKMLTLKGAVNLFHDSGYEFSTAEATINLGKGFAEGGKPIRGQGPFGTLQAEGFYIEDNGDKFYFKGKAKLVIFENAKLGQGTK